MAALFDGELRTAVLVEAGVDGVGQLPKPGSMRVGPRLKPGSILEDALATFDVTSALPDGWRRDREADELTGPRMPASP